MGMKGGCDGERPSIIEWAIVIIIIVFTGLLFF